MPPQFAYHRGEWTRLALANAKLDGQIAGSAQTWSLEELE